MRGERARGGECSGSARGFVTRDSWIARARRSKRHPPRFHRVEKKRATRRTLDAKKQLVVRGSRARNTDWIRCVLSARSADNICRASFSNFCAAPARDWPTLVGTGRAFPISPPPATVRFLDSKLLREGEKNNNVMGLVGVSALLAPIVGHFQRAPSAFLSNLILTPTTERHGSLYP